MVTPAVLLVLANNDVEEDEASTAEEVEADLPNTLETDLLLPFRGNPRFAGGNRDEEGADVSPVDHSVMKKVLR